MTKPKPKPDPREECRGRVRYPTLDGARTALEALRATSWGNCQPKACAVCQGYHLAEPKKQATRRRTAA